jgi:hypothetical protein
VRTRACPRAFCVSLLSDATFPTFSPTFVAFLLRSRSAGVERLCGEPSMGRRRCVQELRKERRSRHWFCQRHAPIFVSPPIHGQIRPMMMCLTELHAFMTPLADWVAAIIRVRHDVLQCSAIRFRVSLCCSRMTRHSNAPQHGTSWPTLAGRAADQPSRGGQLANPRGEGSWPTVRPYWPNFTNVTARSSHARTSHPLATHNPTKPTRAPHDYTHCEHACKCPSSAFTVVLE